MASEASILRTVKNVGNRHSNYSNTIDASSCIVIAIARAGFKGRNSVVYALNYTSNGLQGDPVPLHDRRRRDYLWQNSDLRSEGIRNGSVLKYSISRKGEWLYQGKTNEVKDEILKDSELAIESCVYQGITEACPDACIRDKGVCWEGTAPPPRRNFLLTMKIGFISDERIIFKTRRSEYLDLKLNCRKNLDLSISNTGLRIIEAVYDENSCGDALALIHFCDPTKAYDGTTKHWGVCEGLILAYKPGVISIDNEPVQIQDGDGKYIPLAIGTVKFDSGNDAGTMISDELLAKLDLVVDKSKKIRIALPGGTSMQCNKVKTKIKIRGIEFPVDALAGDPAAGCDLLIGMDIIKQFCSANYSLGE